MRTQASGDSGSERRRMPRPRPRGRPRTQPRIPLLPLILTGADTDDILNSISGTFNINGWLFIVPAVVIAMIVRKTPPLVALLIGTLLGGLFALLFQPDIVANITGAKELSFESGYKGIFNAITVQTSIATDNPALNDLFSSRGMAGMLKTIWLIVCAMVFGGVMDGIGALSRITKSLLGMAKSTFGLFASTVGSCPCRPVSAGSSAFSWTRRGHGAKRDRRGRRERPASAKAPR